MCGPADRNPHRVETGILDVTEIPRLQCDTPGPLLRRFESATQIDASPEQAVVVPGLIFGTEDGSVDRRKKATITIAVVAPVDHGWNAERRIAVVSRLQK